MKLLVLVILIATIPVSAQNAFRLSDASKRVNVRIEFNKCDKDGCTGPAKFSFFRKDSLRPFQTIILPRVEMWDATPKANVTLRYDEQSMINFDDFNFDGLEDVAISDGKNGGYGMPSYQVFLYSKTQNRYVRSPAFTRINQGGNLGFFEVDKKKQMLYRYTKSGCCWHQTEGFAVIKGQPKKVYEFTEDATIGDGTKVKITTRRLINAKWRKSVKYAKTSEYYK